MEPVSFIAGYLTDKSTAAIESLFRKQVIERLSRHRVNEFFRLLAEELEKETLSEVVLRENLDKLFDDEQRSEMVFEAYRAVCLSKSKTIGPRIIALITAKLIRKKCIANDEEELILRAAESMSDSELQDFSNFCEKSIENFKTQVNPEQIDFEEGFSIVLEKQSQDSNWSRGELMIGPTNLARELGIWADRLNSLGMISSTVNERTWEYDVDTEMYRDEPGQVREIIWEAHITPEALMLFELIKKASPAAPQRE